ncbi:MAG: hypothetical protein H8D45_13130 [Bacteroidetes bacterium]|nr:hypothetical protein [Bacteroidota bacterium]MBL7105195.1 hypothetical protein [Bacteroidales bacterium]
MKNLVRKITSIVLALAFLISSSGFLISEHYCKTTNLKQLSFLIEYFDCDHNEVTNHEDCNKNYTCCETQQISAILVKEKTKNTHDCCETKKHFFKIESVFDKPVIKNSVLVISKTIHLYKDIVNIDDDIEDNKPDAKPDLKIHLFSGKKLVFFLHQQKIAPPVL